MTSSKPTLVIISGGWHMPQSYAKLTNALQSAGFEVHVPRLPSMNEKRPPNTDLIDDTALIRSYVESLVEAGRIVIAIMHSYGGGSMVSKVKEFGHEHLLPLAFDFAEDDSCIDRDPKMLLVGPGIDAAKTEAYVASLVRWNGKSMYQAVTNCAWREIAVTYIYTKDDMTVPLDYQKSMTEYVQAEGQEVHTVELATGHCPNLTMTQEVVEVILQVAAHVQA